MCYSPVDTDLNHCESVLCGWLGAVDRFVQVEKLEEKERGEKNTPALGWLTNTACVSAPSALTHAPDNARTRGARRAPPAAALCSTWLAAMHAMHIAAL